MLDQRKAIINQVITGQLRRYLLYYTVSVTQDTQVDRTVTYAGQGYH